MILAMDTGCISVDDALYTDTVSHDTHPPSSLDGCYLLPITHLLVFISLLNMSSPFPRATKKSHATVIAAVKPQQRSCQFVKITTVISLPKQAEQILGCGWRKLHPILLPIVGQYIMLEPSDHCRSHTLKKLRSLHLLSSPMVS